MNLADDVTQPARNLSEWLSWEDAYLLDCSFGMQYLSADDMAGELSRDPLLVLRRILSSEIPDMVGFEAAPGSEEEAEFLALGLAGAPLELALRWCSANAGQGDRPEWDELAMYLTADLRPAMELVREAGLWLTGAAQLDALLCLTEYPMEAVARAGQQLLDRIDVPTPPEVLKQLLRGAAATEAAVDWPRIVAASLLRQATSQAKPRWYGKRRSAASSTAGAARTYRPRRKRWAKARAR
jgi:hypothetical protein